ncbi:hypothetical protein [Sphingobium sp. Sx8-8]|uniref:hypothetical protein n=1 Tax=Sphingobium sp. Sx8-8 TaxID=2933617 RepID=UPI001F58E181|nr:hypothetical protein [Sphingobium sp. Sx8-8]
MTLLADLRLNRRTVLAGIASSAIALPSTAVAYVNERISGPGYAAGGARWLLQNFGDVIAGKVAGTPFSRSLLCAMAYQETGYVWYTSLRRQVSATELLRLLVLDNSTPRSVFPRDTASFQADRRFGSLAKELISASDASRRARGVKPTGKLLFGYGLFQNDLQNIERNPEFWTDEMGKDAAGNPIHGVWGDIGKSTDYFIRELAGKYDNAGRNMRRAVRAYNGSNSSSQIYLENVTIYEKAIADSLGERSLL